MTSRWSNRGGLLAAVVAVGVLVGVWAFSSAFVSPQARACVKLYNAARTAADSMAVDTTVPAGAYQTLEPRSCKSFRGAARWLARR
jgi:hypothetical protein